ncbi:helix-turn-helix transcriptional regulator [Halosimplex sp. J119]
MKGDSLVTYVARSELRSTLLREVERDPRPTTALRADLDVSQSGVYKTLDELADRGLVRQSERWELTARGRLVADELGRQRSVEDLLDDAFWDDHDVSVLPRRFRQRLAGPGEWELYHNPARNPQYLERLAVELFREADWLRVGAQVYYPRFAQMVDELADRGALDAQVIVDDRLVDEAIERYTDGETPSCVDERVADLPFSFTVTADLVVLSLPGRDGISDLDAVLVGSGEGAVELGRDVHGYYWDRAVPVEDYLATV